jgi:hypothetical protein
MLARQGKVSFAAARTVFRFSSGLLPSTSNLPRYSRFFEGGGQLFNFGRGAVVGVVSENAAKSEVRELRESAQTEIFLVDEESD